MRRLFLVACYDPQGKAGGALMHYLRLLSQRGDVAVCFDNELGGNDMENLRSFCKVVLAARHGEYDFGSYKRLYTWACETSLLKSYDMIYLLNDSVYCLSQDLKQLFEDVEAFEEDAVGMVLNPHHGESYIESWFVGLKAKIFNSSWFADFLMGVSLVENKVEVCRRYENGLTRLILENGCTAGALLKVSGRGVYNSPLKLYRRGMPFVKKNSFVRHNGSLGFQLNRLLKMVNPDIVAEIRTDLDRLHGQDYSAKLLTFNYFSSLYRYLSYLLRKLGL